MSILRRIVFSDSCCWSLNMSAGRGCHGFSRGGVVNRPFDDVYGYARVRFICSSWLVRQ